MRRPPLYTNPISITNQFPFCGLPLRIDSYAGCAFQCSYCFARYRAGYSYEDSIRPADPARIDRIFKRALSEQSEAGGVVAQFLQRRVPVHFGGMSDPFQPVEVRFRVTEAILRTLGRYSYPTVVSTKGALVSDDRYIHLLLNIGLVVVQFSFSTLKDEIAKKVEPHSTPPSVLLRAMEALAKAGIVVTCRWQPYIPGLSETPSDFISRVASTGCRHVALEHLKVPMERNQALWGTLVSAIGQDLRELYLKKEATRVAREYLLPAREKLSTLLEVRECVRKHGMTFGAADNEFQYLSDTECCCSGVDQFRGFENWFRHQIGYAVRRSKGKEITYSLISEEWAPTGSMNRYLNSHCRLPNGSLRAHVRAKWDAMLDASSPASFYGVVPVKNKRVAGRRVYDWHRESLLRLDGGWVSLSGESGDDGTFMEILRAF